MSAVELHSVVARRQGAEGARLGAEYVLLDPEGRTLRGLNPTGARIWELLDGTRTLGDVVLKLASEHEGADEARIAEDVLRFAELLLSRGLADRVPSR